MKTGENRVNRIKSRKPLPSGGFQYYQPILFIILKRDQAFFFLRAKITITTAAAAATPSAIPPISQPFTLDSL